MLSLINYAYSIKTSVDKPEGYGSNCLALVRVNKYLIQIIMQLQTNGFRIYFGK